MTACSQPLPSPSRRHWLRGAAGGLLAGSGSLIGSAWAQRGESPLRLTVAYPPGGVSDETARELARGLQARTSQLVRVDYRPGAGGALALEALAREGADGNALCFCAITPLLGRGAAAGVTRADWTKDIAPVAAVMSTPVLVVGTPAFGGANMADLVATARRGAGRIRWASSGQATTGHLVLEQIRQLAHADITHVPYAGGGQQLNDALAGHFEVLSSNVAARQLGYLQEGRLRALAVGAPQRLAVLPDVPTLAEQGYAAANLSSLFGVFGTARAPAAQLDRLNAHINAVIDEAGFRQRLQASGNTRSQGSRADFALRIAAERLALGPLLDGAARV